MNDTQKLGLVILLLIVAVPLLIVAVFLLPITLAAKLAIIGGAALVGAGFTAITITPRS